MKTPEKMAKMPDSMIKARDAKINRNKLMESIQLYETLVTNGSVSVNSYSKDDFIFVMLADDSGKRVESTQIIKINKDKYNDWKDIAIFNKVKGNPSQDEFSIGLSLFGAKAIKRYS